MSFSHEFERHIQKAQQLGDEQRVTAFRAERDRFVELVKGGVLFELPREGEVDVNKVFEDVARIFSLRLRDLRDAQGLTYFQLGELVGMHRSAIGKFERREMLPLASTLQVLADRLETSVSFLIGETPDPRLNHIEIVNDLSFGQRIEQLRVERGINKKRLAETSGTSRTELYKIIRNDVSPKLKNCVYLALGLGVPIGKLFGERIIEQKAGSENILGN